VLQRVSEFTPAHLLATAKGWREDYGRYLPLLPVVYHRLESYDRRGDTHPCCNRPRHGVLAVAPEVTVERDLKNPSFLEALQCKCKARSATLPLVNAGALSSATPLLEPARQACARSASAEQAARS